MKDPISGDAEWIRRLSPILPSPFVKRPSVASSIADCLPASGAHFALWLRSLAVLLMILSPPLLLSCCDPPTRGGAHFPSVSRW
jgi:hypothetical protein